MLYIVSTPIGNLEDITLRALKVLREADLILAEDTRKAGVLLNRYKIKKPLLSFHDHNKKTRTKQVLNRLTEKEVALISEAGTPGISDPGFYLIRECVEQRISFTAIPGPTAAINALILSGFATDRFLFQGFLSPKRGKRKKQLKELSLIKTTLIIYESCHRIVKTLLDIKEVFKNKRIALIKEMTKVYEEIIRGNAEEIIFKLEPKPVKGEFVVVIDNR